MAVLGHHNSVWFEHLMSKSLANSFRTFAVPHVLTSSSKDNGSIVTCVFTLEISGYSGYTGGTDISMSVFSLKYCSFLR